MGLDRIANFNIAHGDQNPRPPPCFSRGRLIACYDVINLISLNEGKTVNRKVTSSDSVAIPQPGGAEERGRVLPAGSCLCLRRNLKCPLVPSVTVGEGNGKAGVPSALCPAPAPMRGCCGTWPWTCSLHCYGCSYTRAYLQKRVHGGTGGWELFQAWMQAGSAPSTTGAAAVDAEVLPERVPGTAVMIIFIKRKYTLAIQCSKGVCRLLFRWCSAALRQPAESSFQEKNQ